ncbi:MAG: chitobiase/beta-hexosaminidase C-terminal domain-containing protein, partial [bacterium]
SGDENDNILILSFEEIGSYDVDTTPTIKYSNSADLFSTHDLAGNQLATYEVTTIDKSAPTAPTADPAGGDYDLDQLVVLSSAERGTDIRYTTDGVDPTIKTGTVYDKAILITSDTTLKAIAIDGYDNISPVMTEIYGIAPVISGEISSSVTSSSLTITWTTDDPSTSRVIYDTVSHTLGTAPNYGYANSTIEDSTKVTSHSVGLTGLSADTTYYYRTVSHGSPESVSSERTTKTTTATSSSSDSGSGGTSTSTSTVCNDEKPGTPTLLSATSSADNSVVLTWSLAPDPVTYYLVAYGTSPGTIQYGNPNVGGHDTTTTTVSGLSAGTNYYFVVRAGNGCATGEFSNELSANPSGEILSGPASGFEEGVLGTSTESDNDTNSPDYVKQNDQDGEVMGETKTSNTWWYWLLLIPAGWLFYTLFKKRHQIK